MEMKNHTGTLWGEEPMAKGNYSQGKDKKKKKAAGSKKDTKSSKPAPRR